MSATQMAVAPAREQEIIATLKSIVSEMAGVRAADLDVDATFIEMGAESLFLLQASQAITEKLGVRIPFRLLMEEYPTLRSLAAHIDQKLPAAAPVAVVQSEVAEPEPQPASVVQPVELPKPEIPSAQPQNITGGSTLEQIVAQQLQIMSQQLEVMRARQGRGSASAPATTVTTTQPAAVSQPAISVPTKTEEQPFVPFRPISKPAASTLTEQQQRHLDALIDRVSKKTQRSKQLTQEFRPYFADSREVAGFRSIWKEILYLIIVEQALGSKIWDVDGNEYLDITMGFGALLFGHSPDFVTDALQQQLAQGIQLGPQSHLAGQVAKLVCELTGTERATFCNSGTEAVMTALRLARTVSGRTKIAMFTGSYHGSFDGTLARAERGADGKIRTVPLAPGVPPSMVEDVMILTYGAPESLAEFRQHASELAAVLVEPLQSRRPDNRPSEFLQELRRITEQAGTVLIFDEVVSGFRLHPGGAQVLFDIRADLVTYGKAAGAGLPIGIIAGKAKYMDPIDGGMWQYGDASYPRAETTFFVGTFFKHPMVMAAAHAALTHLKNSGPQLQEGLNQKTQYLADTLNHYFEQEHVPIRITNCGSLFRFANTNEVKYMDIFFYHLLEKGIYVWEGRNCFISTAHTDEDVEFLISKVKETVVEMRAGGFLGEAPVNAQTNGHKTSAPPVEAVRRFPLTDGQKQLWTLAQIDPDASRAYNESLSLHIRGALNVSALRSAVQQLVNRHDALRITIDPETQEQVIASSMQIGVPLLDLSKKNNAETFIADWQLEEARKLFDFIHGPLFRANVLRVAQQYHVLVLTVHHLVIDGWSFGVLLRELSSLYEAECRRVPPSLPPAKQFSEYVQWQSQQQQGGEMERAEAYWLDQYADSVPVLELPTDRPRPSVQTYNGGREQLTIDASLCSAIKHVSARERVTLFMTLLASYQVLLHRLTNQDDVVVGIGAAGQASVTGDDLIGYCINLLPLRSRTGDDPSFSEYLARSKRLLSDAFDHQIYQLPNLIKKLGIPRDPSRPPLVTVAFNLDRGGNRLQFYDLDVEVIPVSANSAKFDLFLNVTDQDGELILDMDYNSDLFDATTIHRWLGHLRTLLGGIVADPRQRLSELPLLDEQQRQQVMVEWNQTNRAYPSDSTIQSMFEAQVVARPKAVAVADEKEQLSYEELNRRANQLAHYLRRQGVDRQSLVGVCLKPGAELVVALLGALKAGAAYVPLDPNYPQERLRFMLADADVKVLITHPQLVQSLGQSGLVISLNQLAAELSAENDEDPVQTTTAQDLAYVIYTSGSTGQPKGVGIEHRGVLNLISWHQAYYEVTPEDRATQVASPAFDASVWELWPYLTAGASVHIVDEETRLSPSKLVAWLREQQITLTFLPTPLAEAVLSEARAAELNLKALLTGGDLLHRGDWGRLRFKLVNHYGPTEYTVVGTCGDVSPDTQDTHDTPAIGRPIANTRAYICDEKLQLVPVGIAGHLLLAGDGLARGYIGRPDLTAERFLPNPFSTDGGARLYLTGDLARYRLDGQIEFVGRADSQVKVRGFRIELGEIEAVLCRHPNVREAVVVFRSNDEEKRLVAYVAGEVEAAASELRSYLKQHLPEYMIPAAFVVLDKLPLNKNGKVDRKQLPAPGLSRPSLAATYVEPRTETERVLAKIWSEVLPVKQVGIHDNFFELGGDSILSVQIIARVHQAGLQLTSRQIFFHQTVAELAAVAESAPPVTAAAQGEVTGPVELTPIQHWFFEQELAEPNHFNMSVMVTVGNEMNMDAMRGSLAAVLRHHDALRMRYVKLNDGAWRQRCAPVSEVDVPLAIVDLSAVPEEELRAAIERVAADSQRTLDLEHGPIFKAVYMDLGAHRTARLLLVVHHLVMDMISWRILLEDLQTAYKQLADGEAVELRAKTTSFQQWAAQLKAYASSDELAQEVGYWTDVRRRRIQPLPVDDHGRNLESTVKYANSKLSSELTEVLLREVPRVYNTQINEVLMAALAGAHQRWTGEQCLIVAVEGHGREALSDDVLLTRTVGWFTSIYPLLLEVDTGSDYGERLKSIKEQVRRLKNGGIGYGVLRYLSADETLRRQLRDQPEAEISFNYLGQVDQAMSEVKEAGLFGPAAESVGLLRAGQGERRYKLQVNGTVVGGELHMSWEYSPEVHREETVAQLAADYVAELERLIRHCQNANAGGLTPSDFAEFKWSESDLEDISAAIAKARGTV